MRHKPTAAGRRTDRNFVGKVVQRLRHQQNLTQEDLVGRAAQLNWMISRDIVKNIERGEREVNDIELRYLAAALKVHPTILLEEPKTLPPYPKPTPP